MHVYSLSFSRTDKYILLLTLKSTHDASIFLKLSCSNLSDRLPRFLVFKDLTCIPFLCFFRIVCVCKRSHLYVEFQVSIYCAPV